MCIDGYRWTLVTTQIWQMAWKSILIRKSCLPCHQVWFHSGQRIEVASKDNSLIISKCPVGGQSLCVRSLKTFSMPSNSSNKVWAWMKCLELIQILQNCVLCVWTPPVSFQPESQGYVKSWDVQLFEIVPNSVDIRHLQVHTRSKVRSFIRRKKLSFGSEQ